MFENLLHQNYFEFSSSCLHIFQCWCLKRDFPKWVTSKDIQKWRWLLTKSIASEKAQWGFHCLLFLLLLLFFIIIRKKAQFFTAIHRCAVFIIFIWNENIFFNIMHTILRPFLIMSCLILHFSYENDFGLHMIFVRRLVLTWRLKATRNKPIRDFYPLRNQPISLFFSSFFLRNLEFIRYHLSPRPHW